MAAMATLYVRNVPAELYAKLQEWAAESGDSVNAAILEFLEARGRAPEAARRVSSGCSRS